MNSPNLSSTRTIRRARPWTPASRLLALAAAAACVLAVGACEARVTGPTDAGAPSFLVGGEPDFAHTNVAAVVTNIPFLPDNPLGPFCSGTLIAADVVVTAGHCGFWFLELGLDVWVTFDQQYSETSPLIAVREVILHPGFVPSRNPLDVSGVGGDVAELAVLLLATPVTDRDPATLPAAGLLDELRRNKQLRAGVQFTVVGYGASAIEDGFPVWDDQRRFAIMPFSSLLPTAIQLGSQQQKHTPSACFGDSGGATFLVVDGEVVLTSVLWWIGGGPLAGPNFFANSCSSWLRAYRLDTEQARSFLRKYVELP